MPSSPRTALLAAAGLALLLSGCTPDDVRPAAAPVPAPPPADTVTVTRIVDGDTFDVADGRTVRVLGIDSCETGTDAGQAATDAATGWLLGKPVTLVAEQGADLDRYGRNLRYVTMPDGQDFGKVMVPAPHTGVYPGGDANPQVTAALSVLDIDGRVCEQPEPAPVTSSEAPPPVVVQDDDRPYVPAPNRDDSTGSSGSNSGTKPRSGNSGHPCGPGERDGDDDGYCGEK